MFTTQAHAADRSGPRWVAWIVTALAVLAGAAAVFGWLRSGPLEVLPKATTQADLHLTDSASSAGGALLDLSSFRSASESLGAGELRIDWPGAKGLGDSEITNVSVTVDSADLALVFDGRIDLDGSNVAAMLILDWENETSTPTVSLGVKGQLDMADLNSAWKLDDSAFVITGYSAMATGEQDLRVIESAASFYGDRETLGAGIEVEGTVSLGSVLPGVGPDGGVELAMSASLDGDINALLTASELEPVNAANVSFTASVAASDLGIPALPGVTAGSFEVQVDLAGENDEAELEVAAIASLEIDNAAVSEDPVTFELRVASLDGAATISGGLAEGSGWTEPFGAEITIDAVDVALDIPGGGDTPTLTFSGTVGLGTGTLDGDAPAVDFEIVANDELAVSLSLDSVTIGELLTAVDVLGVGTADIPEGLATTAIESATIDLQTDAGNVSATIETTINFRDKDTTLFVSGSTDSTQPLIVAVLVPSYTVRELAPGIGAAAGDLVLPSGAFILSTADVAKAAFPAGGPVDVFLSGQFCEAADATETEECEYTVPAGLSLAAQVTLPAKWRSSLEGLGAFADEPIVITGTLPVFGDGDVDLTIELPTLTPQDSSWLKQANLSLSLEAGAGGIAVSITGDIVTFMPDGETAAGLPLVQEVAFTATGSFAVGPDGFSLGLEAGLDGSWESPFGIEWLDFNGLLLQVDVNVSSTGQASATVGVATSVTLDAPCVIFDDVDCPPGPVPSSTTFEASFAIGVGPNGVTFGFRFYADQLALRDVAAIAKKMGADIDPAGLPDASLREVEVSFSLIDAPDLCLERGLIVAADVYLTTPTAPADAAPEVNSGLCSNTANSTTPLVAAQRCLSDEECFAHLRLDVSERGITASAALNGFSVGPVTVDDAIVAIALTEDEQSLYVAGMVKVAGLGEAIGSIGIDDTGIEFTLATENALTGRRLSMRGSLNSLNIKEDGLAIKLQVFVEPVALNAALVGAQDVIDVLKDFFTGEPLATRYHLRCLEVEVDLIIGAPGEEDRDPISGNLTARVHFSATDTATQFEDGRVWAIGWDFDATIIENVGGLAASLSGATSADETGCAFAPTTLGIRQVDTPDGSPLPGQDVGSDVLVADFGDQVFIEAEWTSNDFSTYRAELDLGLGNGPIDLQQGLFANGQRVGGGLSNTYVAGDGTPVERRTITARLFGGDDADLVIDTVRKDIILGGDEFSGHVMNNLSAPGQQVEGGTMLFFAQWTNLRPDLDTDATSYWSYQFFDSLLPITLPSQLRVTGPIEGYPANSEHGDIRAIEIPNSCPDCTLRLTHGVVSFANGQEVRDENVTEYTIEGTLPTIDAVLVPNELGVALLPEDVPGVGKNGTTVVAFSDENIDGPYDLYVNDVFMSRIPTPDGSLFGVSLAQFHQPAGGSSDLTFQVFSVQDRKRVGSEPFELTVNWLPENSSFASPQEIFINPGQVGSTTVTSTTRYPEFFDDNMMDEQPFFPFEFTQHCGSVWFRYVAVADGGILLDTAGSRVDQARPDGSTDQEIAIEVFVGTTVENRVQLRNVDDGSLYTAAMDGDPTTTVAPRQLTFPVVQGQTYLIAATSSDYTTDSLTLENCDDDPTVSGPVQLTLTPLEVPPVQDENLGSFEQTDEIDQFVLFERIDGFGLNDSVSTNLDYALSDNLDDVALGAAGFDACFDDPLEQTVWYILGYSAVGHELPIDVIAAGGQNSDVQIAVFGTPDLFDETLTELVGCSESAAPGSSFFEQDTPTVTFTPQEGLTYVVMIDTNGRHSASVTPLITGAHSSPANARVLVTGGAPAGASTTLAAPLFSLSDVPTNSPCGFDDLVHHHAYSWTAENSSVVDISVRGDIASTIIAFEAIENDGAEREVACTSSAGRRDSTLTLNPTAGQTYLIMVGSEVSEADRTYEIDVTARGDDTRSPADADVASFPASFGGSNTDATTDGASSSCFGSDSTSVVHEMTIPNDLDVDIDTFGSDVDTRLVLETSSGTEVGCNDNAASTGSFQRNATGNAGGARVRVGVDDAETYVVRVDGRDGAEGDVRFNVTTRGDNVANAVPVTGKAAEGAPATSTLSNEFASVEPDEQRGACHRLGEALDNTVWWTWTATSDGIYDIDVSGFAAQLTVFDGASGAPGGIIGCGETLSASGTATDAVPLRAGETVFIQADGVGAASGQAALVIEFGEELPVEPPTTEPPTTEPPTTEPPAPVAAFSPLNPVRVADTRSNGETIDDRFEGDGPVAGGDFYEIVIAGRGAVPPDAAAAVLNITSVRSELGGFLTVFPCGVRPNASAVNFEQGSNTPNEVIAKLSTDGSICVFASQTTHLLVDAVAFSAAASPYSALTPARIADTRAGGETIDQEFQRAGAVKAGTFYEIQIAGRGGVSTTATTAVMNVTSVGSAANGFLTLWPCGERPNASALNYQQGVNTANEVITKLSSTGAVCVFSAQTTQLLIDVVGEIVGGASSGFESLSPVRLADTRAGAGKTVDSDFVGRGPVGAGEFYEVQIAGRGGVSLEATTAVVNITSVRPAGPGFFTVWPCGTRPNTSALNFAAGQNRANEIIAKLSSTGSICVFTSTDAEMLVDVVGAA